MRRIFVLLALAAALIAVVAPGQAHASTEVGKFTMATKMTGIRVAQNGGLVATGTVIGRLRTTGGTVVRDTAPARFRVSQRRTAVRCDVLTLNLAKLHLELLGVTVDTSAINLEVFGRRQGAILGRLFCTIADAEVRFPRTAIAAANRRLRAQPITVASSAPVRVADHQGTCQILNLVLGPLHLDLLGLVVDLYGETKTRPVRVTITGEPGHGRLSNLLCSLAGSGQITDLPALQSLLQSLGVNISDLDLQNLLNSLGLGHLSGGLTQLQLQQILDALGIGNTPLPPP
jgi:hypothetical protein